MIESPCIVYVTDIDVSRENGAGVNERAFVTAAIARPGILCVLPSPSHSFRFSDPRVRYVFGHHGSPGRYAMHVMAALAELFRLRSRHRIHAVATRLGLLPLAPLVFSTFCGIPLLLKTHSGYQPLDRLTPNDWLPTNRAKRRKLRIRAVNRLVTPIHNAVVRRATIIDAPSPICKMTILAQSGLAPDRVAVIPNGTNADLFIPHDRQAARETLGLPVQHTIVGYVGALNRDKRCLDHLVRALAALHRKNLAVLGVIVGDGPDRGPLEHLARAEGIADLVRFEGTVPLERVPVYMSAFDVGVDLCAAPMRMPDGTVGYSSYSQKMAQYLACGVPVVAWDVLDNRFIAEADLGYLPRLFDSDDLAGGIERLLRTDPAQRALRTERIRQYAVNHLSYSAIAKRRFQLWDAALAAIESTRKPAP